MQNSTVREIGNRDSASILATMRQIAVDQTARYPQYAGKYDGAGLARVVSTKGLRPRGRRMWPVGKLALGRMSDFPDGADDVLLYEAGYGDCALPQRCIEWVIRPS